VGAESVRLLRNYNVGAQAALLLAIRGKMPMSPLQGMPSYPATCGSCAVRRVTES
jgi:hypothetical protein